MVDKYPINFNQFNRGRAWLQEDFINLAEMVEEGHGWYYIAARLGRSIGMCKEVYSKLRMVKKMDVAAITTLRNSVILEPLRGRNKI